VVRNTGPLKTNDFQRKGDDKAAANLTEGAVHNVGVSLEDPFDVEVGRVEVCIAQLMKGRKSLLLWPLGSPYDNPVS